jgi:hypothetical protein
MPLQAGKFQMLHLVLHLLAQKVLFSKFKNNKKIIGPQPN